MGDRVAAAFKHAVVGTVVAVGAAQIADMATKVVSQAMPTSPDGGMQSNTGRQFMLGAGAIGVSVLALVAGDQLISQLVGDDDPLFRLFYYQLSFHNMQASSILSRQIDGLLRTLTSPAAPKPAVAPEAHAQSSCGNSSCGGGA